jgi:putative FmdB family regulatory protein
MPIYEFKCLKCNDIFELLLMTNDQKLEPSCPKCHSREIERVLSAASYNIGNRTGQSNGAISQSRTCSSGSCTTYDIPGPKH